MKLKVRKKAKQEMVFMAEGKRVMVITKVEDGGEITKYTGKRENTVFVTFEDKVNNIEKKTRFIDSESEKSHIAKLIVSALGEIPDEFDSDDLIGKQIVVEIKHNEKEGFIYQNVVGTYSIDSVDPSELINPEALEIDSEDQEIEEIDDEDILEGVL